MTASPDARTVIRVTSRASRDSLKVLLVVATSVLATAVGQPEPAVAATGWTWPVSGEVITQYRNGANPYAGGRHRGIDVAAPAGTPVVAAVAGTVRFAGIAGSSGLTVSVRTADGRFDTSYLHLALVQVGKGDRVGPGERIGAVGTSGKRSAAAPHLHFGVREAGSRHAYRDPLGLLPPPGTPPVRERPRVPVPWGAPVRVGPAPEPVRLPSPSRSPRTAPARRRVRVPAGTRIRFPAGGRAPVPRFGPARLPLRRPVPVTRPGRVARRAPRPGRVPSRGPAPTPDATPRGVPVAAPAERRLSSPRPAGGFDLGWALACAGLLLAAACLGRPRGRDAHGERRRGSLGSLRRPLFGRR